MFKKIFFILCVVTAPIYAAQEQKEQAELEQLPADAQEHYLALATLENYESKKTNPKLLTSKSKHSIIKIRKSFHKAMSFIMAKEEFELYKDRSYKTIKDTFLYPNKKTNYPHFNMCFLSEELQSLMACQNPAYVEHYLAAAQQVIEKEVNPKFVPLFNKLVSQTLAHDKKYKKLAQQYAAKAEEAFAKK